MLHPSMVHCMELISAEWSSLWSQDSITDSRTLMFTITITELVGALVITNSCLQYLLSLTFSLQAEVKDVVDAVTEVIHVIGAPKMARQNVMIHQREWFNIIEEMCHMAGVAPCLPRLCRHPSSTE